MNKRSLRFEFEKLALDGQLKTLLYGLGAGVAGLGINHVAADSFDASLKASRRSKEDRQLTEKLVKDSKYPVHHSKHMDSAMLVLDPSPATLAGIKDELKVQLSEKGHSIVANPKALVPSVLAHEVGHGSFHEGAIGRFLQNNGDSIKTLGTAAGLGLGVLGGAGLGGKHNRALNVASVAAPSLAKFVGDVPEIVASAKAIRQLEEAGANPEQLKRAKGQLLRAYASYASMLPAYAATGFFGQSIGHGAAKLAGVGSRAASLLTGSKARTLRSAARQHADEAGMLRRVADAGGTWSQRSDSRFSTRVMQSAVREGRAADKAKALYKKERSAVNAARGALGGAAVGAIAGSQLEKRALLERLVRLGATDVPGTPRLLMRQRSPQELAGLQQGVSNWWGKKVSEPIMGMANKGLNKLPAGKVRNIATSGAKLVAQDPVGAIAANAVPIPGASLAYFGMKRGLERAIDRIAPLATSATPSV